MNFKYQISYFQIHFGSFEKFGIHIKQNIRRVKKWIFVKATPVMTTASTQALPPPGLKYTAV